MIYILISCLLILVANEYFSSKVKGLSYWLRALSILLLPIAHILEIDSVETAILPILLTQFLVLQKRRFVDKLMAFVPSFLMLSQQYLVLGLSIQIVYLTFFYRKERSSLDLFFTVILLFNIFSNYEVVNAISFSLIVLIMLGEYLLGKQFVVTRLIPLLTVLAIKPDLLFAITELTSLYFWIGIIFYSLFINKKNVFKNNLLLITYIFMVLIRGNVLVQFSSLALLVFLSVTLASDVLSRAKSIKVRYLNVVKDGFALNLSYIFLFLLIPTIEYKLIPLLVLSLTGLVSILFSNLYKKPNKNVLYFEVGISLILILLCFPFGSYPTRFLFLLENKTFSNGHWGISSIVVYILNISFFALIYALRKKFLRTVDYYLYKLEFSNESRSKLFTKRLTQILNIFSNIKKTKSLEINRPLAFEALLLLAGTMLKRQAIVSWLIITALVAAMVIV